MKKAVLMSIALLFCFSMMTNNAEAQENVPIVRQDFKNGVVDGVKNDAQNLKDGYEKAAQKEMSRATDPRFNGKRPPKRPDSERVREEVPPEVGGN